MYGLWQEALVHFKSCMGKGAALLGKKGRRFGLACFFYTELVEDLCLSTAVCKASGMDLSYR